MSNELTADDECDAMPANLTAAQAHLIMQTEDADSGGVSVAPWSGLAQRLVSVAPD